MITKFISLVAVIALLAGCSSSGSDIASTKPQADPLNSEYAVTELNDNTASEEIMASEAETETKPVYVDPIVQSDEADM